MVIDVNEIELPACQLFTCDTQRHCHGYVRAVPVYCVQRPGYDFGLMGRVVEDQYLNHPFTHDNSILTCRMLAQSSFADDGATLGWATGQ